MATLRVISGSAKGKRLKTVPGDSTRPITDQVKEALFNILADEVLDIDILDLFGGTGAVGIEALSRGANSVLFLDTSHQAIKVIKDNLQTTKFSQQATVIRGDAFAYIQNPSRLGYDLIYVAPPQYKDMWEKAMRLLDENPDLLHDDGQIIVQINPIEWSEQNYENFIEFDRRKYGDTELIFFEKPYDDLEDEDSSNDVESESNENDICN
ncbi:MAG TPA: 16S rRNA (guanine(966)-N(2))-methyltransferase RsmD [Anaerolineaceae bacterium]|nr:16S rRNA (guanine(966)-N(2))-methyltransferase RsmD [Anaerolineaceae bacterium]HQL92207.1 16S rRNA (guanine(966)-N(2))-methyltransferase RsmD [Anaerolineaceae bacterium]